HTGIELTHVVNKGDFDMQAWRDVRVDHLTKLQQHAALSFLDNIQRVTQEQNRCQYDKNKRNIASGHNQRPPLRLSLVAASRRCCSVTALVNSRKLELSTLRSPGVLARWLCWPMRSSGRYITLFPPSTATITLLV